MSAKFSLTFITGTNTGVGKTLFTSLLIARARALGLDFAALKPFCSGGWGDVEAIEQVQPGRLTRREITPWYFTEPVTPLVAARKDEVDVKLTSVTQHIREIWKKVPHLVIEGAGGLLSPLGEQWTALDLIRELKCPVLIVARNQLGVLNHTLLTTLALRTNACRDIQVIVSGRPQNDYSAASNTSILKEWLSTVPVWELPEYPQPLKLKAEFERAAEESRETLDGIISGILK